HLTLPLFQWPSYVGMSLLYTEHPGVWGPHEHQHAAMPLKSPIPLTQGRSMEFWMPVACSRQHSMSEWENLPAYRCLGPSMARAKCNEESMERQPFSDITARLLLQRIQA